MNRPPQAWRRAAAVVSPIVLFQLLGCSPVNGMQQGCEVVQRSTGLPPGLQETSGVVASQRHEGVIWTHNDSGGEAEVVGVYLDGRPAGRVRVRGARAEDWEDLALGPCAGEGSCLYIGDIGDGSANRSGITIYRIPEPDPATAPEVTAEVFPMRYPDGARDAEALFVLPSGELYLVSLDGSIYRIGAEEG